MKNIFILLLLISCLRSAAQNDSIICARSAPQTDTTGYSLTTSGAGPSFIGEPFPIYISEDTVSLLYFYNDATRTYQSIGMPGRNDVRIDILADSSINIDGDTLAGIWIMDYWIKRSDSILRAKYDLIEQSLYWFNTIPDIYKTNANPYWKKYYAMLRKEGYRFSGDKKKNHGKQK